MNINLLNFSDKLGTYITGKTVVGAISAAILHIVAMSGVLSTVISPEMCDAIATAFAGLAVIGLRDAQGRVQTALAKVEATQLEVAVAQGIIDNVTDNIPVTEPPAPAA
jgi:hypothetical protein